MYKEIHVIFFLNFRACGTSTSVTRSCSLL